MIRIGITPGYLHPDPDRATYGGKTLNYLERDTANYLLRLHALPVLIPDCEPEHLKLVMQELDGVILQGGEDVAPKSYGESPIGKWKGDRLRDLFDFRILDLAMQLDLPVFGICRGFQIMNVYFGGTLYQDISTQLLTADKHLCPEAYDLHHHKIEFTGPGILQQLYKDVATPVVNSIHHQGVKALAPDLELLAAHPEDGIAEAFALRDPHHRPVMGVQWHPEFGYKFPSMLDADLLLRHFLQLARE